MKIAICDDNQRCREDLHQVLISCEEQLISASDNQPSSGSIVTSIKQFSSGRELVDSYEDQGFDLIFLDVEMPELSGLETGQKIREMNKDVMMVFLTNHPGYVFESIPIEVIGFLIKPAKLGEISKVLTRANAKYLASHQQIILRQKDSFVAMETKDIIYVESYHRKTTFHTEYGAFVCADKLDEYESKLSPYDFLRCHQGILVNMNYIRSIDDQTITTSTGPTIAMSVRKKRHCLETFTKFIGRNVR